MKKSFIFIFLFLTGCTTAVIPSYLPDNHPYTQRYLYTHTPVVDAVKTVLTDAGWKVEKVADPAVYEQQLDKKPEGEQTLLITEIRQTPFFLGTRYTRLNVFVHSNKSVSDVEIRYLGMTSTFFKNFRSLRNDGTAKKLLDSIEKELIQTQAAPSP